MYKRLSIYKNKCCIFIHNKIKNGALVPTSCFNHVYTLLLKSYLAIFILLKIENDTLGVLYLIKFR